MVKVMYNDKLVYMLVIQVCFFCIILWNEKKVLISTLYPSQPGAVFLLPAWHLISRMCHGPNCRWPGYSECTGRKPRGRYSHTWARYIGSAVMTTVFEIFNPMGSLFHVLSRSDWPPPPCRKNQFVSNTFSSRDTWTYIWSNFSSKCII